VVAAVDADDPLKMTGRAMFEYACHEGNYGLPAILRGAREQERFGKPDSPWSLVLRPSSVSVFAL
jgi:hypothetical protein